MRAQSLLSCLLNKYTSYNLEPIDKFWYLANKSLLGEYISIAESLG